VLNKMIGAILLIIGTSIGGGMLALPVLTAQAGFIPALMLMIATWFLMTVSAFWILEVNLWLPEDSNLISMAKATLGRAGQAVAWVAYLLLLYCLLSAYIAGGGDVVQHLLSVLHLSHTLSALLFVFVLGTVVAYGVQSVDWVNRGLLMIKLAAYLLLVVLAVEHVRISLLSHFKMALIGLAVMPAITSFGYAIIIPNLRTYLNSDVKQLRRVVAIGSCTPLFFYIIWEVATLGVLPLDGLTAMFGSGHAVSDLMTAIGVVSDTSVAHTTAQLFTSICVATSFLGVSLAMCHFLRDGLNASQSKMANGFILLLTYLPPLLAVLFFPNVFLTGLNYAGVCCVVLLLFLPAAMVFSGRYVKKIASGYQTWGGPTLPILVMLVSVGLIVFDANHLF
jgi:tyrosine-specific transport protein